MREQILGSLIAFGGRPRPPAPGLDRVSANAMSVNVMMTKMEFGVSKALFGGEPTVTESFLDRAFIS